MGTQAQSQPPNSSKWQSAQNPVVPTLVGGKLIGFVGDPVCPPGGLPGGVGHTVGGGSGGRTIGCVG